MNYRAVNRIVRKGTRATVLKHILWGVAGLAVLGPASYMFGRASGQPEWDKPYLRDVWSQRAVTETGQQDIPDTVQALLTPLGNVEITRASLNGRTVFSSRYPLAPGETIPGKLHDLQITWQNSGITAQTVRGAILAADPNQNYLLNASVSVDDERAIQLDCWDSQGRTGTHDMASAALEAVDLPTPPEGSTVDNLSEGRGGNAFSFTSTSDIDAVAEDYLTRLEERGWKQQEMPSGGPEVSTYFRLMRKGSHHLTIQFASIPGTGTIASLIVF